MAQKIKPLDDEKKRRLFAAEESLRDAYGGEVRYYLHQHEYDYFKLHLGEEWVQHHCILVQPLKYL